MDKRICTVILVVYAIMLIGGAACAEASESLPVLRLRLGSSEIQVTAGRTETDTLALSPVSIEAGIDCGMPEMCGINPCTCGSADRWGCCSCNGLKKVYPSISVKSRNPDVATAKYSDGRVSVKGIKSGTAEIDVTASLLHYKDANQTITVKVEPVNPVYSALAAGLPVMILLSACASAAAIIRKRHREGRLL